MPFLLIPIQSRSILIASIRIELLPKLAFVRKVYCKELIRHYSKDNECIHFRHKLNRNLGTVTYSFSFNLFDLINYFYMRIFFPKNLLKHNKDCFYHSSYQLRWHLHPRQALQIHLRHWKQHLHLIDLSKEFCIF